MQLDNIKTNDSCKFVILNNLMRDELNFTAYIGQQVNPLINLYYPFR